MTFPRHFWARATAAPFAAVLAVFAILGGVRTVLDPTSLPVQGLIGPLMYVWSAMAIVGGVMLLVGAGTSHTKTEAAGCVLFTGATFVQAVALFTALGYGFTTFWSVVNLLLFAGAALIRARRLVRGQHLVWVSSTGIGYPPTAVGMLGATLILPFLVSAAAPSIDLSYVLAALGIIGAIGGSVVAFRKAKPDSAAVLVDASKDVVMIQRGVIEELQAGLKEATQEAAEATRRLRELNTLEYEVARLRDEVKALQAENAQLRQVNDELRSELDGRST